MARRLVPLLDRVLVEKITAPTKSAGGVLLPESAVPKVCGWVGDSSSRKVAAGASLLQ
jgi:co-chaperonin GroES (HSP10)